MPRTVEVFYSFRSPYCYLVTDRLTSLARDFEVEAKIRPVYPIAVRDPEFFRRVDPLYRPYHLRDSLRLAEYLNIPYRRPAPDPLRSCAAPSAAEREMQRGYAWPRPQMYACVCGWCRNLFFTLIT